MKKTIIIFLFLLFPTSKSVSWGFFAHQHINRLAVFTLPPEMITFYKHHIQYITEEAVSPDRRRYAVEGEAPRHYIDIDAYGDSAIFTMPRYWSKAVKLYTQDTLEKYGTVPWHIYLVSHRLTEAFKRNDAKGIVRISADLAHYIADANVPLHTTVNYDGQLTGQEGIHGFWESRLPEVFFQGYGFFVGSAEYVKNMQLKAWEAVINAHRAVDSVLLFEKQLSSKFPPDKKYSFEERNGNTVKVYSYSFSKRYHQMLSGQVEERMKASVKMIGDFWYTCWVNAGQPNLNALIDKALPLQMASSTDTLKNVKSRDRKHE